MMVSRGKKVVLIVICTVIVAVIGVGILFCYRFSKTRNIVEFVSQQNQEVFILGTFHSSHFNKMINYSMEDIISCIDNIQPDVVFIESRENVYDEFDVIDGPIDMILTYSHCTSNGIPVEMIDYWELSNTAKSNTTTAERDDKIHENIMQKMSQTDADKRILIVCGSTHLTEQSKRFSQNNFIKADISNKADYFKANNSDFKYPAVMSEVINNKITYLKNIFPDEIVQKITDEQVKQQWNADAAQLCKSLESILQDYVKPNALH